MNKELEEILMDYVTYEEYNTLRTIYQENKEELKETKIELQRAKLALRLIVDGEDINEVQLPHYVSLEGTALRLTNDGEDEMYWRDAGGWGTNFKYKKGKLVSDISHIENIHNKELIPITKEQYNAQNSGYVNEKDCPNCQEGLLVEIKGKLFCEDCHIEIKR